MPIYFIMKSSPCNPLMTDPNSTGAVLRRLSCRFLVIQTSNGTFKRRLVSIQIYLQNRSGLEGFLYNFCNKNPSIFVTKISNIIFHAILMAICADEPTQKLTKKTAWHKRNVRANHPQQLKL